MPGAPWIGMDGRLDSLRLQSSRYFDEQRGGGVAVSIWKDAAAASKTILGKVGLLKAVDRS